MQRAVGFIPISPLLVGRRNGHEPAPITSTA